MKKLILLTTVFAIVMGCEKFTEGINENPNEFTDAEADIVVGTPILASVHNANSQLSRVAAIWTDQLSGCDRQYISFETYSVTASDSDSPWSGFYQESIVQAINVTKEAEQSGNKILQGIGQLLQALSFGELTSLWGSVPFSQAGSVDEFPNPKYDSQKDVLAGVQSLLDKAIANLGASKVSSFYASNIYISNDATWSKMAYSLKARYYLVAKDYANALKNAKLGIQSPSESIMSIQENTQGKKNLYYQFIEEQRGGYISLCNTPTLLDLISPTGTKSRTLATPGNANILSYYFTPSSSGEYNEESTPNTNLGGKFGPAESMSVIDFYEVKLIEAEAAQRTGDDVVAQTALNAVRTQLAVQYGVDATQFPATTSAGATLLTEILEEKYITLIGSIQVFNDVRRTNNLIGVKVKGIGFSNIPQRLFYPQSEIDANSSFPGQVDLKTPTSVNKLAK